MFGWARPRKKQQRNAGAKFGIDRSAPAQLLDVIGAAVPPYLEKVDQGGLVYPACIRKSADLDGDIRSVWAHTRLEAARYLTMVPGRQIGLLIEPAQQSQMFDAFLRLPPHEDTVIEFSGVPTDDLGQAIFAGLNWLNHCSLLVRVDRRRMSGTIRQFRKLAVTAQQWWLLEGAEARCAEMLKSEERPPLMLNLIWRSYTMFSKEIASASLFGPSTESTVAIRQKMLREQFAEDPRGLEAALADLRDAMSRLEAAQEPDDLLG